MSFNPEDRIDPSQPARSKKETLERDDVTSATVQRLRQMGIR